MVGGAGVVVDRWGFCFNTGLGGGAGRTGTRDTGGFTDLALGIVRIHKLPYFSKN